MHNFIYLLNIYDVKVGDCYHFIESRTVSVTCPKSHNQVRLKSQTYRLSWPWVIIFGLSLIDLSHSETHIFETVCQINRMFITFLDQAFVHILNTFNGEQPKMPYL